MREMTVREVNQNLSQVIAAAESGETIVVTKNGLAVARISPLTLDRSGDADWMASFTRLRESLYAKPATGFRVGSITEDDLYGDAP